MSSQVAEIQKLRAALEKEKQATQHLIDSSVHYRNLAIVLGAKPEQMMGGVMNACPGDWVIRGVAGEFYPCNDAIFRRTYEAVES